MQHSFVLYTSYLEHIELLSMNQRGILLTAVMNYVAHLEMPEMDGMVTMAFSFIKAQIDRDKEKYEQTVEKRREAGKKGGRPKANGFTPKAKKANGFLEKQKNPVYEYDYEYEYVDDNDKDKKYMCAFEDLWSAYPRKKEKAKAYKCYQARLRDGFSEDELLGAVKRYADECTRNKTEQKYIKLGATFLGPNTPFVDYLDRREDSDVRGKIKPDVTDIVNRAIAEGYDAEFTGF